VNKCTDILTYDELTSADSEVSEQPVESLDDWLTVQRSIILFDLQIDALNSYLFTYNTFIKILYMFRVSSGGLRRNCTGSGKKKPDNF
jgi:hypothetical protein